MTRAVRFLVAFASLVAAPVVLPAQQPSEPFPHAKHERLFPTCVGCHTGIASGDESRALPSPALCASCHDGTIKPRVEWSPPARTEVGLLNFTHAGHFGAAKDVSCTSCHSMGRDTAWMNVSRAVPEECVACHAHQAASHLADDNICATCHRPLTAATGLSVERVAALPKPPSHAAADFIEAHGKGARALNANCATCHARESCARCHVDASRSGVIRALGADKRVAQLVAAKAPVYPTPPDHLTPQFGLGHGTAAQANIARCATCHARASCETCHTGDAAKTVLRQLPDAREAGSKGVRLTRVAVQPLADARAANQPPDQPPVQLASLHHNVPADTGAHAVQMHPPGFVRGHGALASSGQLQCAGCHAQRFCSDCHVGEFSGRRYHPVNFVTTHPARAYGRDNDCTSCHNIETFCRSCHIQAGLAAKSGVRSIVYHNGQQLWLLQHGRAARQDLPNCATCHQQTYCMQCHSDVGSRISPHGPDFDAARMYARNPQMCLICHLKNPLGGN